MNWRSFGGVVEAAEITPPGTTLYYGQDKVFSNSNFLVRASKL